jgi:membrane carboxypeptidase/penicillin-binding protein
MALGVFEATPLEIAQAYIVFANEGLGVMPFGIKRVTIRAARGAGSGGNRAGEWAARERILPAPPASVTP